MIDNFAIRPLSRLKSAKIFFLLFYLIGFIGIVVPITHNLFIRLIPLALILEVGALVLFHEAKIGIKVISVGIFVFLLGLFIEIIGVNTGLIFGKYTYGDGLGMKVFNTPICIGINWLMLVYVTASILHSIRLSVFWKIVYGSLLMVIYDVLLEWVAPSMGMWVWDQNKIPLQNFLAWFIIAFFFHSLFRIFHVETKNKIASFLFGVQITFFFTLALYFNLNK